MDYNTFCNIDKIIKKYSTNYAIYNEPKTLRVGLLAYVNEELKEFILNELDLKLPLGLYFNHTYENGKLNITFYNN